MEYVTLVVGPYRTNCYLAWNEEKKAIVIDPGDEADFISEEIEKRGLTLIGILLTHTHWDHVGAVKELQLIYKIPILSKPPFGLKIIKTPGHTNDSICFYDKKEGILFSGDTLFKELPTRNENLKSIAILMKLPEDTLVLPGHDENTRIGVEKMRY